MKRNEKHGGYLSQERWRRTKEAHDFIKACLSGYCKLPNSECALPRPLERDSEQSVFGKLPRRRRTSTLPRNSFAVAGSLRMTNGETAHSAFFIDKAGCLRAPSIAERHIA